MRGKLSSKGFSPKDVSDYGPLAKKFWTVVQQIPGFGEPSSRSKTVAAQPVVLKGLARLAYDLALGSKADQNDIWRDSGSLLKAGSWTSVIKTECGGC